MRIIADYNPDTLNLEIKMAQYNDIQLTKIKSIDGRKWHKEGKYWEIPLYKAPEFKTLFPQIEWIEQTTYLKALLDYKEKYGNGHKDSLDIPYGYIFKRLPFEHQRTIIKKCLNHDKYAVLAEMGTGKTQSLICAYDILTRLHKITRPCLIVCPKTCMQNWADEININTDYHSIILDGTRSGRLRKLEGIAEFYIINYEGCIVIKEELQNRENRGFEMIILDESTYIKNHRAQRTKTLNEIAQNIQYRYILSGTPITNAPLDAFSQFEFLSPHLLGFSNYYAFRGRYCIFGGWKNKEIINYQHLDELKEKISEHSIRILKKDCLDLPEKLYQVRYLEQTPELICQYKEMAKTLQLELLDGEKVTAPIVLTKLLRLSQINSGHWLKKKNPKLDEIEGLLPQIGGKLVIWTIFRDSMANIITLLQRLHIHAVWLTGDTPTEERQVLINKFNTNDDIKVFVGMIQAGGLGINLASASTVIYYENSFSLEDRLQSEDRTHRIGTKQNVTYIDLIYPKTIDEKVYQALKDKKNMAEYLIDNIKEII